MHETLGYARKENSYAAAAIGVSQDKYVNEPTPRELEVRAQISNLAYALKGIEQGLDTLRDRLNPVSRSEPPMPPMAPAQPQPGERPLNTAIGSEISSLAAIARQCNTQIQSAIACLEV